MDDWTAVTTSRCDGPAGGGTVLARRAVAVAAVALLVVGIVAVLHPTPPPAAGQAAGEWSVVPVPLPSGPVGTTARGINEQGQVVGYFPTGDGGYQPFRWDMRDGALDLLVGGGLAIAVDDAGRAYGADRDGVPTRWDAPDTPTPLPVPAGFEGLVPAAVSPAGHAVSRKRADLRVLVWTPELEAHVVLLPPGDVVSVDDQGRVTLVTGVGPGRAVSRVSLDGSVEQGPTEDIGSSFFHTALSPNGRWWLYEWAAEGEGTRMFVGESMETRRELVCPNEVVPGPTQGWPGDAWGLNDNGVVVGRCTVAADREDAVVWLPPGYPLPAGPSTTSPPSDGAPPTSSTPAPPRSAAPVATAVVPAQPVAARPTYTG